MVILKIDSITSESNDRDNLTKCCGNVSTWVNARVGNKRDLYTQKIIQMTKLPSDIENKINQLFTSEMDRVKARELILSLWTEALNVGPAQLARSILIISNGDLNKIIEIKKDFYGDPRDVIMIAESRIGNPGHYFIQPFEDDNNQKQTSGDVN